MRRRILIHQGGLSNPNKQWMKKIYIRRRRIGCREEKRNPKKKKECGKVGKCVPAIPENDDFEQSSPPQWHDFLVTAVVFVVNFDLDAKNAFFVALFRKSLDDWFGLSFVIVNPVLFFKLVLISRERESEKGEKGRELRSLSAPPQCYYAQRTPLYFARKNVICIIFYETL